MKHLEYKSLLKLPKLASEIEIKRVTLIEICDNYIKNYLK